MKSLQPSPICSWLFRQLTTLGPPVSRLLMPCPYSWAMTPASRSLSRCGGRSVLTDRTTSSGALFFISVPSSWLTITDGIVIVASAPPMPPGAPGTLLTTITPMAPAAWALATFTTKVHKPRSTMAMLPGGKPTNGSQPSLVGSVPSLATTAVPGTGPVSASCGPKAALEAG